jgi:photosystem II stability/assembly factor-like uncharacterized protein
VTGPRRPSPVLAASALGLFLALSAGAVAAQAPAAPAAAPAASAAAKTDEVKIDAETFGGVSLRSIGPAAMSGRIAAIDGIEGDRLTLYVGSAGGGVWKSMDGGTTFKPVFDKYCQSIGAIAIDKARPKTVWVGTGESWTRNSVSVGDGIYKTTDAGDNWTRMGLEDCERIARIVIDPRHPDTVYVAATGHLWDANPNRGVYRTRDGGKTWSKVLFVNDDTGCGDVAMDPSDPNTLYAGMWQFRRKPWSFSSGGPGSGLYKSSDGGDHWTRLTKGLPSGDLGRIAISVSPARPSRVYAFVEAKPRAMYRSEDKGESWTQTYSGGGPTDRPFYFAHLIADPRDPNRVYKCATQLWASEDSTRTFTAIAGGVHSDFHALWINPRNPEVLYCGTDGGVYTSVDRGNTWRFLGNLPVGQFYHVSYDMEWPYNVYGGLQDNGSWTGPSRRPGGIANRHWRVLGGGDGFWAWVDPNDADVTYVEYQEGNILRVNRSTGETKQIKPLEDPKDPKYRFNWNTPVLMSPSRAGTLYMGSQFLFRSRDRGDSFERISPDLTTNDPAKQKQDESGGLSVDNSSAENHCTIFTISESPKNPDVVWVGTDDGNVQITRDGGKTWTNVGKKIPGVPPATWVTCIEAGRFDEGTAFATFDGHGTGDMKTYVYKTTDFGKTWQSLASDGLTGYAHVVRQDLVRPELLFLGTEQGLFVSIDAGAQWAPIRGEFPPVAVRDLSIHPREGDLLIATHGRALWILDDLTPLRALTHDLVEKEAAFLPSRPSVMIIPSSEQRFDASEYAGEVPSEAATVTYYLKKRQLFGDIKLQFYDTQGRLISTIPGSKRRGINRVQWPMRMKGPKVPPAGNDVPLGFAAFGPRLPAGAYPVKLIRGTATGAETLSTTVTLVPDPRSKHTAEDRAVQQTTVLKLYDDLGTLSYIVDAIVDVRDQARARAKGLAAGDALGKKLSSVADRLESLRRTIVASREGGQLAGEQQLREKMGSLYGAVNGYDGRPTASQLKFVGFCEGKMFEAQKEFESIVRELPELNVGLAGKKLDPMAAMSRDDWQKKQPKN